jgi:hypothetical protein
MVEDGSFEWPQRRAPDDARGGTGKREVAPLGGGWGETTDYRLGAPFSTCGRRSGRGAFGCVAKVGGLSRGLLECVFLTFDPYFF